MAESMTIECDESVPTTLVLRVRGHLDAKGSPILMEKARTCREGGRHLILNLAGVTFIASSGIGALLALVEDARENGSGVRFAALSAQVRSVIDLLNLDQFLTIDPDEATALAALTGRAA